MNGGMHSMIRPTPRLVVLDLGHPSPDRLSGATERLCIAELLSLVNELADLGVGETRLVLHDIDALDDLARLIEYARRRRCSVTAVWLARADAGAIGEVASAKPDAIAVPLHSHTAATRQANDGKVMDWNGSIHLAAAVRSTGSPLEIETAMVPTNALPILPLSEAVESLHPASWRLDFSHARLTEASAAAVATAIAQVAELSHMHVSVHELPALRRLIMQRPTQLLPAHQALLATTGAAESMHITWSGDVQNDGDLVAGNVRLQTLAAIYQRSPVYVAMRSAAPRGVASTRLARPLRESISARPRESGETELLL